MKRTIAAIWALAVLLTPLAGRSAELPGPVKSVDGLQYYNGGVGLDERMSLGQVFPLKLVFVDTSGAYLSRVTVKVSGKGYPEKVVEADSGPWLFLDLPPGTYQVIASYQGTEKKGVITLGQGVRKVQIFYWP